MSRWQRIGPWALAFAAIAGTAIWARRSGDFDGYLTVGELALAGRDIYRESPPGINTWPPFFSLLCVPMALLARPTVYLARVAWLATNFVCLWVALRMLTRLVYGARLRMCGNGSAIRFVSPEIVLPLVLCGRFVLSNFEHLQVNILIFACATAGLYWHARGHDVGGGLALGCAAALKVMPALFVPYFVYRKRWRMALSMTVATVAFSIAPVAVYGRARFAEYVGAWYRALSVGWGVGKMNQSVSAMFDRYLGQPDPPWRAAMLPVVPASGDLRVTTATLVVLAAVTLGAVVLFRGRQPPDSPASLAEYGVVFSVSALFGPVAWKAYLVVLLCPLMLLVRLLRQRWGTKEERRVVVTALMTYFVLAAVPGTDLLGKAFSNRLEMLSFPTLGTLVLLALVFWIRPRVAARAPRRWSQADL